MWPRPSLPEKQYFCSSSHTDGAAGAVRTHAAGHLWEYAWGKRFRETLTMPKAKSKIQVNNKRASFDYEFLETYTAGIVLTGTEIKSIRAGKASLQDAYCYFDLQGQLYVRGMNVAQYFWGSWGQHEQTRDRKLLLTKKELRHLRNASRDKGITIVAVRLYIADNGYAKLLIALARGKKQYDKRQSIKDKDLRREMDRGDALK